VCVSVPLAIQHAKQMRRNVLSSEASPAVSRFSTLSHKRNDFLKEVILRKIYMFDSLYNFYLKISHSEKNSAKYYYKRTHVSM
jgi:hypothetical protein